MEIKINRVKRKVKSVGDLRKYTKPGVVAELVVNADGEMPDLTTKEAKDLWSRSTQVAMVVLEPKSAKEFKRLLGASYWAKKPDEVFDRASKGRYTKAQKEVLIRLKDYSSREPLAATLRLALFFISCYGDKKTKELLSWSCSHLAYYKTRLTAGGLL